MILLKKILIIQQFYFPLMKIKNIKIMFWKFNEAVFSFNKNDVQFIPLFPDATNNLSLKMQTVQFIVSVTFGATKNDSIQKMHLVVHIIYLFISVT